MVGIDLWPGECHPKAITQAIVFTVAHPDAGFVQPGDQYFPVLVDKSTWNHVQFESDHSTSGVLERVFGWPSGQPGECVPEPGLER